MSRLENLRRTLAHHEFDVLLVSQPENRRYLSEFTGSTGWLLISPSNALLAVDFRYVEQAKSEAPEFEVTHIHGELANWLPKLASDFRFKTLGFEGSHISFATYHQLCRTIDEDHLSLQLIPTDDIVESLRAVKEAQEIQFVTEAVQLADAVLDYARAVIRPGMTEMDLAWELERFLRDKGSQSIPFGIVVASGPNSALPHAKPSQRAIREGEPIVVDLGARVNGYCSDLTRTLYMGKQDSAFSRVYDTVLGAQLTAQAAIESGMNGNEADRLARIVIQEANYGEAFGHGLGHGVGLEAHESPRLAPSSPDLLADGMVFTVEPGVYLPGWGGIRIEDTVVMENGKTRTLATAEKIASTQGGGIP